MVDPRGPEVDKVMAYYEQERAPVARGRLQPLAYWTIRCQVATNLERKKKILAPRPNQFLKLESEKAVTVFFAIKPFADRLLQLLNEQMAFWQAKPQSA